jgi:predicted nucleic acid-binding Zn finger protein
MKDNRVAIKEKDVNKEKDKKNSKKTKNFRLKGFDLPHEVLKSAKKGISYDLYKSLLLTYGKRGEKAFNYLKEDRIKKYLDFFVIVGEEEYIVEDDFCTCNDFQINLKGRVPCAHILALKISKLLRHYKEFNLYYVDYMENLENRKK